MCPIKLWATTSWTGKEGLDHPIYCEPDTLRWWQEDELRYTQALLYAGVEPEPRYYEHTSVDGDTRWFADVDDLDTHHEWQRRVTGVLMHKYKNMWWYQWLTGERLRGDPQYKRKAEQTWDHIAEDELRKFYTWLCKERGEAWTARLDFLNTT